MITKKEVIAMIKNSGTKKIETKRLILRRFKIDDVECFYNNVGNDNLIDKHVLWNKHKDKKETETLINKWVEDYNNDFVYRWVVELKEINEVIGSISCHKIDPKNLTCEVGYSYCSKYWNKGYATEALKTVLDYLKEEGFKTVYASHLGLNPASGKVMLKSGMQYEGTLRNRIIDKTTGEYDNLVFYSILFE